MACTTSFLPSLLSQTRVASVSKGKGWFGQMASMNPSLAEGHKLNAINFQCSSNLSSNLGIQMFSFCVTALSEPVSKGDNKCYR